MTLRKRVLLFAYRWGLRRQPEEWLAEGDGRPLARLVEPRLDDMFWYWWRVIPLPEVGDSLLADGALWSPPRMVFREPASGLEARAFTAVGAPTPRVGHEGRLEVLVRGLYLP